MYNEYIKLLVYGLIYVNTSFLSLFYIILKIHYSYRFDVVRERNK